MSDAKTFSRQLKQFGIKTTQKVQNAFVFATQEVRQSVVLGSEVTGAPGQPVDTGNLRASWQGDFLSKTEWELSTNVQYAVFIEDGGNDLGPFTLRSQVGGFHSVKLTRGNWDRIVEFAALRAGARV